MGGISCGQRWICFFFVGVLIVLNLGFRVLAHQCSHSHHHGHVDHDHVESNSRQEALLPEEIAELEDLGMINHDHDDSYRGIHRHDGDVELSGMSLWIHALACSLLVSLASLICLIFLPVIFTKGKPSKAVVDALALFGAGAMLGDAFLHQLPHAFGGGNSHSHNHHDEHDHHHVPSEHSHSHSIEELSVGLSILAGIVLFMIVEKLVRFVEDSSSGRTVSGITHHHHKHLKKLKDGDPHEEKGSLSEEDVTETVTSDGASENDVLRKRKPLGVSSEVPDTSGRDVGMNDTEPLQTSEPAKMQSNLVFGYLNLFSDGVHNFTDGMALGSAFLLYGSIGGWSRTLFLLAHELPQEIGDFGILVRSGFTTSKALFFNFLSALVALAGTAVVLIWGKDLGQSAIIEGLTAGGFIYISLGVLAEMNTTVSSLRNAAVELTSFVLGMAVALVISLVE